MKKILLPSLFCLLLLGCQTTEPSTVLHEDWKTYFDKNQVQGGIIIYDLNKQIRHVYNPQWCETAFLPASTFKIPNSLIALETKTITPTDTLKWDGTPKMFKDWEKDHVLKTAFSVSCVPCYQEIARKVGVEKMVEYTAAIPYGTLDITPATLDNFWLGGKSRITPSQQIEFITQLYQNKLPFAQENIDLVKKIMIQDQTTDYTLRAKTGWSSSKEADNGWFVGYAEKGEAVYIFATNIQRSFADGMDGFANARKAITVDCLTQLWQEKQ